MSVRKEMDTHDELLCFYKSRDRMCDGILLVIFRFSCLLLSALHSPVVLLQHDFQVCWRGRKKAAKKEAFPIDNEETKKTLQPMTPKNYQGALEQCGRLINLHLSQLIKAKRASNFMADNPEANLERFEWPNRFVDEIALGTEDKLGVEEPSTDWSISCTAVEKFFGLCPVTVHCENGLSVGRKAWCCVA
ncbi:hypothetical protein EDC01DRAFT_628758 [Geopyxis carbonaria]|nr:hypothetical protein EDC01DRAFT_628758 [Geopyxis carbonaria]